MLCSDTAGHAPVDWACCYFYILMQTGPSAVWAQTERDRMSHQMAGMPRPLTMP